MKSIVIEASLLNGNKSVTYTISMSTDQDNLSPVIDINRCNLITAATRMDNPKGNEDRFGAISQTLIVPTTSDFTVSTVSPDTVSAWTIYCNWCIWRIIYQHSR